MPNKRWKKPDNWPKKSDVARCSAYCRVNMRGEVWTLNERTVAVR